MTASTGKTILIVAALLSLAAGLAATSSAADARVRHHHVRRPAPAPAEQAAPEQQAAQQRGVAGYFGPGAYGPYGYGPFGPFSPGYGYGYGAPHGDLGFALLGAANGGGLRGFVECGNYYARYPGACGF